MRRIAILAALPSELKPLVRGWKRVTAPRFVSLWTRTDADGDELVAACAGMGPEAVRRAFAAAEALGPVDLVLSVGFAGATDAALRVGAVAVASEIVDAQTGERFTLAKDGGRMRLASVGAAADPAEKTRLRASYGALLVDMEAATVARLAAMREIPMSCLKAISDAADEVLPEIAPFVDANGQLALPGFLLHVAMRPSQWPVLARLARHSGLASRALADGLTRFLSYKDWTALNETGSLDCETSVR